MSDRISELEAKLSALAEQVGRFAERLSALEAGLSAAARAQPTAGEDAPRTTGALDAGVQPSAAPDPVVLLGAALPLGGRVLLVLAGAFVLRALTDSGVTPGWLGATFGIAYALVFVVLADRDARAGAPASACVHGLSALLVAFPLLYELVARFRLLGPAQATAGLGLVTSALLLVAYRRRLHALAWLTVAGSAATAVALVFQSERCVPGTILLVLLGVGCLWLGYVRDWRGLRWPVALLADLSVLALALRAVSPYAEEGPHAAMLVQGVLLALYLASFTARTVLRHRGVVAFEVVQTVGVIGAGLGGAAVIATHTTTSAAGFGVVAIACGTATYAVAFAFRERRPQDQANFPFFASVAMLLVMSGAALALGRPALAVVWSALGVSSAALARLLGRRSLGAHAAVYAWGSAVAAGLTALSIDALLAPVSRGWAPLHGTALVAVAAAACAWLLTSRGPETGAGWSSRLPTLALLLLAVSGAVGLAIAALVPAIAGTPGAEVSPSAAGAVRTSTLVAASLLLAWAGRRETGWLAYAILVFTGLKILVEDVPAGRPATLIVTFGVYGTALVLVPRLRARALARKAAGDDPSRATTG